MDRLCDVFVSGADAGVGAGAGLAWLQYALVGGGRSFRWSGRARMQFLRAAMVG